MRERDAVLRCDDMDECNPRLKNNERRKVSGRSAGPEMEEEL